MATKKAAPKSNDLHLTGEGRMNPAAALDGIARPVGLTVANPGGLSNWLKLILMDYAFGATAPAAGSTPLYVGLGTGTFTGGTTDISMLQNGISSEVTTTNWTNYARVSVANTNAQWTGATGVASTQVVTKTNTNAISFTGNATVTGGGPTPTWWFITRAASTSLATDLYAVGTISSGSAAVVNGAAVSFAAAALSILLT